MVALVTVVSSSWVAIINDDPTGDVKTFESGSCFLLWPSPSQEIWLMSTHILSSYCTLSQKGVDNYWLLTKSTVCTVALLKIIFTFYCNKAFTSWQCLFSYCTVQYSSTSTYKCSMINDNSVFVCATVLVPHSSVVATTRVVHVRTVQFCAPTYVPPAKYNVRPRSQDAYAA